MMKLETKKPLLLPVFLIMLLMVSFVTPFVTPVNAWSPSNPKNFTFYEYRCGDTYDHAVVAENRFDMKWTDAIYTWMNRGAMGHITSYEAPIGQVWLASTRAQFLQELGYIRNNLPPYIVVFCYFCAEGSPTRVIEVLFDSMEKYTITIVFYQGSGANGGWGCSQANEYYGILSALGVALGMARCSTGWPWYCNFNYVYTDDSGSGWRDLGRYYTFNGIPTASQGAFCGGWFFGSPYGCQKVWDMCCTKWGLPNWCKP